MLADMLGASRTALAYQMESLGLIKKNQFYEPYKCSKRTYAVKED